MKPSSDSNNCAFSYIFVCLCVLCHLNHVQLFVTLQTVAHQAPPSMGFSRQGCWSGLPCPSPGNLPNSEIESASLAGVFFTTNATREAHLHLCTGCLHVLYSCL